jgi:hypothetical protein
LNSDFGRSFGESRDPAVQHVKQDCPADGLGGVVEIIRRKDQIRFIARTDKLKASYRCHDGVETHANIRSREHRRDQI